MECFLLKADRGFSRADDYILSWTLRGRIDPSVGWVVDILGIVRHTTMIHQLWASEQLRKPRAVTEERANIAIQRILRLRLLPWIACDGPLMSRKSGLVQRPSIHIRTRRYRGIENFKGAVKLNPIFHFGLDYSLSLSHFKPF
jgi:hypothetical protein